MNKNFNITIMLDEVMKSKDISVRRLSILSGISRAYISNLRDGKTNNPTVNIVAILAQALDVPITDLIRW